MISTALLEGGGDHRGRAKYDPSAAPRGALRSPGRSRGHKAMALNEVPTFLSALEAYDGDPRTRIALRLMVFTFTRISELRAARWSEFEKLEGTGPVWRMGPAIMAQVSTRIPLFGLGPQGSGTGSASPMRFSSMSGRLASRTPSSRSPFFGGERNVGGHPTISVGCHQSPPRHLLIASVIAARLFGVPSTFRTALRKWERSPQ